MTVPGANPKEKAISYLQYNTKVWLGREELCSALRGLTSVSLLIVIQKHDPESRYKVLTSLVIVSL